MSANLSFVAAPGASQKKKKNCRKGYLHKTQSIILTRGKFPPFCRLAGSCWTRSSIRYSENTATQNMAPPHTVTCFLSFILLCLLSGISIFIYFFKTPFTRVFFFVQKEKKVLENWNAILHSAGAKNDGMEPTT